MIATLEGILEQVSGDSVIINVGGIGYEITVSASTRNRLPPEGRAVKLYISETVGIYGGGTNLYGFLTIEEKNIYLTFKDLKNTGAKKALDYLDKAVKSLPDFKRAVQEKNIKVLTSLFGFRSQTAEKILVFLQDKLSAMQVSGQEKWGSSTLSADRGADAVSALVALGYREQQARRAVEEAFASSDNKDMAAGILIKIALKYIK